MACPVMIGDSRAWALEDEDDQTEFIGEIFRDSEDCFDNLLKDMPEEPISLDGTCLCVGSCCCLDQSGRPKATILGPLMQSSDELSSGNSQDDLSVPLPYHSKRRHTRRKSRKHSTGHARDCAKALVEPSSSD
mmetsp:Transcript_8379/g.15412  ORF Transcript_8379/g.15412 Transcript_8379/m.15412 type:complete len:133 (-) Transcript_8379:84-482(-)